MYTPFLLVSTEVNQYCKYCACIRVTRCKALHYIKSVTLKASQYKPDITSLTLQALHYKPCIIKLTLLALDKSVKYNRDKHPVAILAPSICSGKGSNTLTIVFILMSSSYQLNRVAYLHHYPDLIS